MKENEKNMKAIIIGSGISGLTAACYLVKQGWEVTVYEQFNRIGGVTAPIEKEGYKWDLGQLIIERFGPDESVGKVLSEIDVLKKIRTIRAERTYVFPDFDLYKPENHEDNFWRKEKLAELFPSEVIGLEKYYKFYVRMWEIATLALKAKYSRGSKSMFLKLRMSIKLLPLLLKKNWNAHKMLEHFFNSKKLQAVFLANLADFMTPPTQFAGLGIPFLNPETAFDKDMPRKVSKIGEHPGLWYILGGVSSLIDVMVQTIKESGGTFKIDNVVKKIVVDNGVATSIILKDDSKDFADLIIASGGAKETFLDMVGIESLSDEFVQKIKDIPLMESVFMVHLGIDFNPITYQKNPVVYYYGTYEVERGIVECKSGKFHEGRDGFVIFIPSLVSPELAPPGYHTITIYTIAPNTLKEGTWEERREELADKLLIEAEKFIPGLREHTQTRVIITPDDFKKITHLKHHAFGGFSPVMGKSGIPHKTPIKNLWFVGAQSESGGSLVNIISDMGFTIKTILKSFKKI